MDAAAEYKRLCELIADNRNREAAERMQAWFDGKSASRQEAAVGLLNRIASLKEDVLRGVISQADATLEGNRITQALLDLAKQLDDTTPPESGSHRVLRRLAPAIVVVLLLIAALTAWLIRAKAPDTKPDAGDTSAAPAVVVDTTLVRGMVFLPGLANRPAAGARLDFDVGRARCVTDESGHFQVAVPAKDGSTLNLMIDYAGKNRFNRNITVSAETPLKLTLNP